MIFASDNLPLQAKGVTFFVNGTEHKALATKEDILSACNNQINAVRVKWRVSSPSGSIQTPQILELSGIGNETLLNSLGIKTLINLPTVGENLQVSAFILTKQLLKNF